jgi:hypothetical protein
LIYNEIYKFSIFTPPSKYKRFEYTPQFYDPEKEAREKRLKQLEAEEDIKAIQKGRKTNQLQTWQPSCG